MRWSSGDDVIRVGFMHRVGKVVEVAGRLAKPCVEGSRHANRIGPRTYWEKSET